MRLLKGLKQLARNADDVTQLLRELVVADGNQRDLLSRKLDQVVTGLDNQSHTLANGFKALELGLDNQSQMLGEALKALIKGSDNQSQMLDEALKAIIKGSDNQSQMLDEALKAIIKGSDNQSRLLDQGLKALIKGSDNQSQTLNEALKASLEGSRNQSELLDRLGREIVSGLDNQSKLFDQGFHSLIEHQASASTTTLQAPPRADEDDDNRSDFDRAMRRLPLMIDKKTYNTSHPDYDATLVRNYPGQIFNADLPCQNPVYAELKRLAKGDTVPDEVWTSVLAEALAEAKTVPGAEQVFERRAYIEDYLAQISHETGAHYAAGWVNLDDALFLYWLVRRLRPRTITQTGVCNGLSSAFMMLGLAKNGPDGTLSVIDLPPVFDPGDPSWRIPGKVYGVVIPEGKTTGWMVPDIYRNRFEVQNGDAKALLPKLVDRVNSIDFFYHDSDHTYDHMMFEFREAKRKLAPGGLIVGDDISWNASVWDFADEHRVPSYNFKGAVGVAFF